MFSTPLLPLPPPNQCPRQEKKAFLHPCIFKIKTIPSGCYNTQGTWSWIYLTG